MKMMGISIRSPAMRFCRSRPLRSGRLTSSTRQVGANTRGRARNSSADANVSGCQPAQRISNSRDSRTETSSSTTKTTGVTCDTRDDLESCSDAVAEIMYIAQLHSKCSTQRREQSRLAEWLQQALHCALCKYSWT